MKLRLRQFMLYDIVSMVYKYGERVNRGLLYHLTFGGRKKLTMIVLASTFLATGIIMNTGKSKISQVLGTSTGNASAFSESTQKPATGTNKQSSTPVKKAPPESARTNPQISAAAVNTSKVETTTVKSADCSGYSSKHIGLDTSPIPELRKLAEYEQLCNGAVVKSTSIFVPTPSTIAQAKISGAQIAGTLKAFSRVGVTPMVFLEPYDLNGEKIDLSTYATGTYDEAIAAYFVALQGGGVSDGEMGTWVLLPEGNQPVWTTTDPAIFTQVVSRTASTLKKFFPGSKASLMLDSKSYAVGTTWGQGKYVSLLPYVQNIPKGLIDSFGIQGFPWASPANLQQDNLFTPKTYLRNDFAIEAARSLGISSIWFNTGTFSRMYAGQPGVTVLVSETDRQIMLSGVVQLAQQTKAQGFIVAVHLFAQNKADLGEGTDWSYWHTLGDDEAATAVFKNFVMELSGAGINTWLYDTVR